MWNKWTYLESLKYWRYASLKSEISVKIYCEILHQNFRNLRGKCHSREQPWLYRLMNRDTQLNFFSLMYIRAQSPWCWYLSAFICQYSFPCSIHLSDRILIIVSIYGLKAYLTNPPTKLTVLYTLCVMKRTCWTSLEVRISISPRSKICSYMVHMRSLCQNIKIKPTNNKWRPCTNVDNLYVEHNILTYNVALFM